MRTRLSFYSLLLLLLVLAYVAGFSVEYMLDPLGRSPVLDGAENLGLAEKIALGELPREPLYRALLYPWVLSLVGQQGTVLALVATVWGVLCHMLNAVFVGMLAKRLWGSRSAAYLASLMYVVYPVALYFSVQVLDITLGMTLFLGAIYLALCACDCSNVAARSTLLMIAGLLGGACVLTRPNFLLPLLLLPVLPAVLYWESARAWRRALLPGGLLLLGLSLPLLGQGLLNQHLSGSFRVLPWQGAYNLYAANHATANGKFFMQSVSFDQIPSGMNPTRMESEYLYRQAKGEAGSTSIDSMNRYWRSELWQEVSADPLRWLQLMGRKSIYVLNDWEQYNNLTYAFHKARFTLLRWNPLGWGVLLLGGVVCGVLGYPRAQRGVFISLGLLGLAYAAGVLLFFASARFRLPLVPLLTVLCGGAAVLPWLEWWRTRRRALIQVGIGCLLGALCVYGNIFDARDEASFIQDELLLADACAKLGEDAEALRYAEAVLLRDPDRGEAQRIQVASLFNLWMNRADGEVSADLWLRLEHALLDVSHEDATTLFISGVYAWHDERPEEAIQIWRTAEKDFPKSSRFSQAAIRVVNQSSASEEADSFIRALLFD